MAPGGTILNGNFVRREGREGGMWLDPQSLESYYISETLFPRSAGKHIQGKRVERKKKCSWE